MPLFYPSPNDDCTTLPYRRTVGHECEFSSGASMAEWLWDKGYAPDNYLHGYGCSCSSGNLYPVHPTSDCTARGGEYLIGGTSGVLFGSPTYMKATEILAEAIRENRANANDRVGMHTHVEANDLSGLQKKRVLRNYLAMESQILDLAAGAFSEVRNNGNMTAKLRLSYLGIPGLTRDATTVPDNSDFWTMALRDWRPDLPGRPTLNFGTRHDTIEFRIWNSARSQWRMVLAGAVSSGLVEQAKRGVNATPDTDVREHLSDVLTPDMLMLIDRQRKFKADH